jgi:hypothetical protein
MRGRGILLPILIFLAITNWALVVIHLADHTSWTASALVATSCTIFSVLAWRSRRA